MRCRRQRRLLCSCLVCLQGGRKSAPCSIVSTHYPLTCAIFFGSAWVKDITTFMLEHSAWYVSSSKHKSKFLSCLTTQKVWEDFAPFQRLSHQKDLKLEDMEMFFKMYKRKVRWLSVLIESSVRLKFYIFQWK